MEMPIYHAMDTTEHWNASGTALGESELAIELTADGKKRLLIGDGQPVGATGGVARLRAKPELMGLPEAADFKALETALADEAEARQSADNAIETALGAETTARAAADAEMESALDAETAARQNADNAIETALGAETTARASAAQTLDAMVRDVKVDGVASDEDVSNELTIHLHRKVEAEALVAMQGDVSLAQDGVIYKVNDGEDRLRLFTKDEGMLKEIDGRTLITIHPTQWNIDPASVLNLSIHGDRLDYRFNIWAVESMSFNSTKIFSMPAGDLHGDALRIIKAGSLGVILYHGLTILLPNGVASSIDYSDPNINQQNVSLFYHEETDEVILAIVINLQSGMTWENPITEICTLSGYGYIDAFTGQDTGPLA